MENKVQADSPALTPKPAVETMVDLAAGKPFTLSSQHGPLPNGQQVTEQHPFFFHTKEGVNQSITIDLEAPALLYELRITNRTDAWQKRAHGLFYCLHDEPKPDLDQCFPVVADEAFLSKANEVSVTELGGSRARYVTIFSAEKTMLHFAAVQVLGLTHAQSLAAEQMLLGAGPKPAIAALNDLAAGKPFTLSSQHGALPKGQQVTELRPFFFHTKEGANQSITIDLETPALLFELRIANRTDAWQERARGLFYCLHDEPKADYDHRFPVVLDKAFLTKANEISVTDLGGSRARYVTIFSPEKTILHFSVVQVLGLPSDLNPALEYFLPALTPKPKLEAMVDLAAGKPFTLSAQYGPLPKGRQVTEHRPFFFHTEEGTNQSITIDLEAPALLFELRIANRTDAWQERAQGLFYCLHDEPKPDFDQRFPVVVEKAFLTKANEVSVTALGGSRARYLTIFSPEKTMLHFSAVQILGLPTELDAAVQHFPDSRTLRVAAAEAAMAREDWAAACEWWQRLIEHSQDEQPCSELYLRYSTALCQQQRYQEAEQLIAARMAQDTDNLLLAIAYAEIAMAQQQWTEAMKRWRGLNQ